MTNNKATVTAINAFKDNYIWAIGHSASNQVVFVDPGDAEVCLAYLSENALQLVAILLTHHHADHTGGVAQLLAHVEQQGQVVTVYGPENDGIRQLSHTMREGDQVTLEFAETTLQVIDVPGHTKGHIAFYNDDWLFCGDTLFSCGCGRLFEGSPEQMHQSLQKLAALNDQTQVYCAHEYTQANLSFAVVVEPDNKKLLEYQQQVDEKRRDNIATIPSTIGLEKQVNPFLRGDSLSIRQQLTSMRGINANNALATFTALRQWKDQF